MSRTPKSPRKKTHSKKTQAKRTYGKNKKKRGHKSKARKSQRPSILKIALRKICKWGLVCGLWVTIIIGLMIAWYAAELPQLTDSPQFERKNAITLFDRDHQEIMRYGDLKGISVTVSELPPHMIYAVLATEDRRFYQHFGLDPVGLARAMAVNITHGDVVQGGSTITQQLAKNLFLSPERTLKRKIQEALLAIWLERELTKDEILSAYLNRVYLGAGAYGVDAAARIYFDKAAAEVTLYEAAMLAGLLKAPSRYSPRSNPGLAAKRTKVVLAAMKDAGYISALEIDNLDQYTPRPHRKPGEAKGVYYFGDWVTSALDDLIGTPPADLRIQTTLDPQIQRTAETALNAALRDHSDRDVTQGAIIVMSADGAVLAMVGGRNYATSQFNRAVQAKRPPGSAIKPLIYLTALEQGWSVHDKIEDAPITSGDYKPENFNREYQGTVTLETALSRSLNTAAVRLLDQVGLPAFINNARKAGINTALPHDLSLALGSAGIPLLEMTTAYATFANDGQRVKPYAIDQITDAQDTILYMHKKPAKRQIFKQSDIRALTDMLVRVIEDGTGTNAKLPWYAAGKTGTSQDYRDAWFIGYTNHLVAGVWIGNDDNSPMAGVTGGTLPAKIWHEIMIESQESILARAEKTGQGHDDSLPRTAGQNRIEKRHDNGSFTAMLGRLLSWGQDDPPPGAKEAP